MIETHVCLEEDWGGNGDYLGDFWNPAHFAKNADLGSPQVERFFKTGDVPRRCEPNGQLTIFFDYEELPDPDDYQSSEVYETAWHEWETRQVKA